MSSDLIDQLYQSSHVVNQLQTAAAAAAAASLGPYPKVEPGVKFRPLAFFDQIELIQKTGKVPGNGTRVAGTQFYIRIPNTAMQKFVQGQVCLNFKYICLTIFFFADTDTRKVQLSNSLCRHEPNFNGQQCPGRRDTDDFALKSERPRARVATAHSTVQSRGRSKATKTANSNYTTGFKLKIY